MRLKKQTATLLLLALFAAWQVDAVVHLLLTPHVICEHGKVVDAHSESDQPHHDSHDEGDDNHKGCAYLALMTVAETWVGPGAPIIVEKEAREIKTVIPYREFVMRHGPELFRLSPSNSPPSHS